MAAPKTGFSKEEEELAKYAKALAAPAKIAILKTLAKRDSCICGEIVRITPLAQSTVSQHLKELKDLGLIQGTVDGVKSCYCIDPEAFAKFRAMFESFLKGIDCRKKACGTKK